MNNWLKDENHPILKKTKEKGGTIFLTSKGEISYRLSFNDTYKITKDYKALSNIFSNYLEINVDFSRFNKTKKIKNNDELDEKSLIKIEDLIMVINETFNPEIKEEFIKLNNGAYLLNKYKQSFYMQLNDDTVDMENFNIEETIIFDFILHLFNYNKRRVYWVINWLAYFFQGLKKAQVALVLVGIEGAGKGILFNEIIKPLFGEAYTKTINDKSLNTKYLGGLVEDVLFFYLDEISSQRSANDSIRNFLKALITNSTITAEKKHKNLENETPLYGQVLISSNEFDALEIGTNDRRYTVFNTGEKLSNTNFLDFGNYESLSEALKAELELFACYLKAYPVDVQMANTALDTPEKDKMIHQYQMKQQIKDIKQQKVLQPKLTKLQKNIDEYAYYIKNRRVEFFEFIRFDNSELFQAIEDDLYHNIFRIENLLPIYKALYGSCSIKTNSELLRELQKVDYQLFNKRNIVLWQIDGVQKDCLDIFEYSHCRRV